MFNLDSHVYKGKCTWLDIDRSYKVYWAKIIKIVRMSAYSQIWMVLFKILLVATIVVVISSGMYK